MKGGEVCIMTESKSYITMKLFKDGKIVDDEKITLPGKLTKQEVKAILTDQYGYEVVRVSSCICQTSK